eukprot:3699997-Pyramimonas_sp.AAC.1
MASWLLPIKRNTEGGGTDRVDSSKKGKSENDDNHANAKLLRRWPACGSRSAARRTPRTAASVGSQ